MNVVGVVLAAGFGMRLRPSTERCPKPLIPVGGIEPLFFAIQRLQKLGIRRAVINGHHLADQVQAALVRWADLFPGMELRFSHETAAILGTGGSIIKIIQDNPDWFGKSGAGLLLQNGDTLAHFDFNRLVREPDNSTLAISFLAQHLKKYNPLWVESSSLSWAGIGKDAQSKQWRAAHFLGVHYLSSAAVSLLSDARAFTATEIDLFNGIYRPLVNRGITFFARECMRGDDANSFWFDMTTPEFLLEAQRYVLATYKQSSFWGELLAQRYPGISEIEPGVWVRQSQKHPKCSYHSPAVWVEKGAASGAAPHARGPLVLGPYASLISEGNSFGADATQAALHIQNSVVFLNGDSSESLPSRLSDSLCVV